MAFKTPDQIATTAVNAGVAKAGLTPGRMLGGSFLAGAYIAFAGLLGIVVTAGMPVATWGNMPTLIFGAGATAVSLLTRTGIDWTGHFARVAERSEDRWRRHPLRSARRPIAAGAGR